MPRSPLFGKLRNCVLTQVYGLYDDAGPPSASAAGAATAPPPPPAPLPQGVQQSVLSWQQRNPGHTHVLWGPRDVEALVEGMFPAFAPAYRWVLGAFTCCTQNTNEACVRPAPSGRSSVPAVCVWVSGWGALLCFVEVVLRCVAASSWWGHVGALVKGTFTAFVPAYRWVSIGDRIQLPCHALLVPMSQRLLAARAAGRPGAIPHRLRVWRHLQRR